jgi:hypothetical protein
LTGGAARSGATGLAGGTCSDGTGFIGGAIFSIGTVGL